MSANRLVMQYLLHPFQTRQTAGLWCKSSSASIYSFRSHLTDTVPACLPLLQAGGQRLVQVVVYLNSLQPDQGGETRFFNPLLKGLAIQVGAQPGRLPSFVVASSLVRTAAVQVPGAVRCSAVRRRALLCGRAAHCSADS